MDGVKLKYVHTLIAIIIFTCLIESAYSRQVALNEIMASNSSTILDEDGHYSDWIEIFNTGSEPVNIGGYGLSDDYENPFGWVFPDTTIGAGDFMLIWASNKNRAIPGEELHTNFAISAEGEEVILKRPDSLRLDELSPIEIPTDISIGRQPDGTGNWIFFTEPTPGRSNVTKGIDEILTPAEFSHKPGFYNEAFDLTISHSDPNVTLFYTTDGSEPTQNSNRVTGPITLYDRSIESNVFSEIPTNYIGGISRFRWRKPKGNVSKATVIRIGAYKKGVLPSETVGTFFIFDEGVQKYSLPVISISTDSENLFGEERGIYVPGISKISGDEYTGNYFKRGHEWEREATFEFFDEHGEQKFSQNIGVRIHGGVSRRYPKKSLRLYARNEYGPPTFKYSIFPESDYGEYKRLILRNSGQDIGQTLIMDPAAQELVRHLDFDTQAYRPAILFLNGEYWGIKNIRERYDRHYLERVYGIDPNNIDLLSGYSIVKVGDLLHFNEVLQFAESNDLSDNNHFDQIKKLIDLENFIDYYSSQIYFGNDDWPHNNIDFWRLKVSYDPDAPKGHDGRWRWLMFDVDRSMNHNTGPDYNIIELLTQKYGKNDREWPNLLFRNLFENENFRIKLINRILDLLNSTFISHRVSTIIDNLKQPLEGEIDEYIHRWNEPQSKEWWSEYIDQSMHRYAVERPTYLRRQIVDHWQTGEEIELSINISNKIHGYVKVNSIDLLPTTPGVSIDTYPWSGIYFGEVPITLKVYEMHGYQFSHWRTNKEDLYGKEITIYPREINRITAIFEERKISEIKPHLLVSGDYNFNEWSVNELANTYPESMFFTFMSDLDPDLESPIAGITFGAYNHESRTRINGLGSDGFSFVNTSNLEGNPGYPGRRLGGAILSLNTQGQGSAMVEWTGGTVDPGSRIYHLRLQYRIGSEGEFKDVIDRFGNIVEYRRNDQAGHREQIGPVQLPPETDDQPEIQLLWRYYYSGVRESEEFGQRSELNISSIKVWSQPLMGSEPGEPKEFKLYQNYPNPFFSQSTIRYDLPKDQYVRLDLYTITGQHIKTLVDGQRRATRHSVTMDASTLASGIYVYRLLTDDYKGSGRLSVIK